MVSLLDGKECLPKGLIAQNVEVLEETVIIGAVLSQGANTCPGCGQRSRRRHGLYWRKLTNLPAFGRRVRINLSVRRYRCLTPWCRTKAFSEKFSVDIVRPHARRTVRLLRLVRHLGFALGGRPAQALASRLLFPVSKDTFLRSVRASQGRINFTPRVIGIDDWAWRRGQRYGTLICDLERRRVIDLLPDREPATVEAWLRNYPGIEIVARDRNGGYGRAVTRALPKAMQVADRWHLLENASTAFLAAVRHSMPAIRKTVSEQPLDPKVLTQAERIQFEGFLCRQQTNQMVRCMAAESQPIRRITRLTGLSRGLIRQILRGVREDVFRVRQSSLEPWLLKLEGEWKGGCKNAAELWRRLTREGFRGSPRTVGEWATRRRRAEATSATSGGKCPPVRKLARMMTTARNRLSKADAIIVAQTEAAIPGLAIARDLVERFTDMVRNGESNKLACWLNDAEQSLLASLARGLRSDQAAVLAAMDQVWSNGQTEGQINKLKTLKRQMYGRANIDLLRARLTAGA